MFGLIGTLIGRVSGVIERRQDHAQERARWTHETALVQLQREARADETEGVVRLAEAAGSWDGLAASLAAEAAIGPTCAWVNGVRALTRPVLTLLLWVITGLVFIGSGAAERSGIVETTTFVATAATLGWFGDRGPRREVR